MTASVPVVDLAFEAQRPSVAVAGHPLGERSISDRGDPIGVRGDGGRKCTCLLELFERVSVQGVEEMEASPGDSGLDDQHVALDE